MTAIEDSVEIRTVPERIWDLFPKIDENYIRWHPKERVKFEMKVEYMKIFRTN